MAEVDQLSSHLARHYIVTVYHSAERFLNEFRYEHGRLHGKRVYNRKDEGKLDPLTRALKHVSASRQEAEAAVGEALIDRFQYYRQVRNWSVHSKDDNTDELVKLHSKLGPYVAEHEKRLESTPGPNLPDELTFMDFILLSRITKAIAKKLCEISAPHEDDWAKLVPLGRFKRLMLNPKRMRNAISGRLRTEHGMDIETADWIAGELAGSLA